MARPVTPVTPSTAERRLIHVETSGENGCDDTPQEGTGNLNQKALRAELQRLDSIELALEAAYREFFALLGGDTPKRRLRGALDSVGSLTDELAYQMAVVRECKHWVKQEAEEAAAFQPTVERMRADYGKNADSATSRPWGTHERKAHGCTVR